MVSVWQLFAGTPISTAAVREYPNKHSRAPYNVQPIIERDSSPLVFHAKPNPT
jgi:hypothetical protein